MELLLKSTDYTCNYNYLRKIPFCVECSIAGAHEKIAECKKQILQAKRIRKNRQGKNDLKDFVYILFPTTTSMKILILKGKIYNVNQFVKNNYI